VWGLLGLPAAVQMEDDGSGKEPAIGDSLLASSAAGQEAAARIAVSLRNPRL